MGQDRKIMNDKFWVDMAGINCGLYEDAILEPGLKKTMKNLRHKNWSPAPKHTYFCCANSPNELN
jgi:hypothetical protein